MKYKIEHEIPEGYEARIEQNKVIITKKESEDEKIRKAVCRIIEQTNLIDWNYTKEQMLAWLEERRQAWTEEDEAFVDDVLPRILEPNRWTIEQNAADRKRLEEFINSFRGRFVSIQKPLTVEDVVEQSKRFGREVEVLHKDEQKPVDEPFEEWIDGWYNEYHRNGYITMDEREFKNFCRGIRNMHQQKPAEWGEEDEEMIEDIIDLLDPNIAASDFHEIENWLKSLPERFNLQPEAEWSEEDKKILDELLDHCNTENATWYNWLKNRCPHLTQKENKEETDSRPFSDFVNTYCLNCGSQRCTREGEWLEGCPLYKTWKAGRDIKFWTFENNDEK